MAKESNLENEAFFLKLVDSGLLTVSDTGVVFSNITHRQLIASKHSTSNLTISLHDPEINKRRTIRVSRLVYLLYVDRNLSSKALIIHKDGNADNLSVSNLEVTNPSDLQRTAMAKKKLITVEDYKKIRELRESGLTHKALADRFRVSVDYIRRTLNGEIYSEVDL